MRSSRFRVEADFETATTSGHARANKLGTDSAYLTFFDENNAEVLVKVLDGCALNGHYWVFAGGLTNVGVSLRVIDTQTGKTKTYTNPKGTVFKAVQDVNAFSCTQ